MSDGVVATACRFCYEQPCICKRATQEELEAIESLLRSEWFFEEMENANYHSAYSFLEELLRFERKIK